MKIAFVYPPYEGPGVPMLSQSRQFQWYSRQTNMFPVVMASAATIASQQGHDILWLDALAQRKSSSSFWTELEGFDPRIVVWESKTAIISQLWAWAERLKEMLPGSKNVVVGDHVAALPEESIQKKGVDFVIDHGNYDSSLLSIVSFLSEGKPIEGGIWQKVESGEVISSQGSAARIELDALPFIDRKLTQAHLYGEKWKRRQPFMNTMAARDCKWSACTFCSWSHLYPNYQERSVDNYLDEIGYLIDNYGVREVFDDSGTFPSGKWLYDFCQGMIDRGYNKKILFSCNMRFDALRSSTLLGLMKKAGFRKLKCGLESANQKTLDRLRKGITREQVIQGCLNAASAGVDIHLTVMVGYPWESEAEISETYQFVKGLMVNGDVEMLQTSVVMPYPGTPLYKEAQEKGWFIVDSKDYDRFDMSMPILRSELVDSSVVASYAYKIYRLHFQPRYILLRLMKMKGLADLNYLARGAVAMLGHLFDFTRKKNGSRTC